MITYKENPNKKDKTIYWPNSQCCIECDLVQFIANAPAMTCRCREDYYPVNSKCSHCKKERNNVKS